MSKYEFKSTPSIVYQLGGVGTIDNNSDFKGWTHILNDVYTNFSSGTFIRKIHYIQTGVSIYSNDSLQKKFETEKTVEVSSIYINSNNFSDNFNVGAELQTYFNRYPDRNFYYYIEYTTTYAGQEYTFYSPTQSEGSVRYYGISRLTPPDSEDCLIYLTNEDEKGKPYKSKAFPIECGRYITLTFPLDTSIQTFSVSAQQMSKEQQKLGGLPCDITDVKETGSEELFDFSNDVLLTSDNNSLLTAGKQMQLLKLEIPQNSFKAMSSDTVDYVSIIIYGYTSKDKQGLVKTITLTVKAAKPQLTLQNNSGISQYNFFTQSLTSLTFYSNYTDTELVLKNANLKLNYNGVIDLTPNKLNIKNGEINCEVSIAEIDKIIEEKTNPNLCHGEYDLDFYCTIEDNRGIIFDTEKTTIKLNLNTAPIITDFSINYIQEDNVIQYDSSQPSHVFFQGMTISPQITFTVFTSDVLQFNLLAVSTSHDKGYPQHQHGAPKEIRVFNNNDGKISKGGTQYTITDYIVEVQPFAVGEYELDTGDQPDQYQSNQTNQMTFLWRPQLVGEYSQTIEEIDLIAKGRYLPKPIISDLKVAVSSDGKSFNVTAANLSHDLIDTSGNPLTLYGINAYMSLTKSIYDGNLIELESPIMQELHKEIALKMGRNWAEFTFKVRIAYILSTIIQGENESSIKFSVSKSYISDDFTLTNAPPTVAYRMNCVGINIAKPEEYDNAAFVVSPYIDETKLANHSKVYFGENKGDNPLGTIDLKTLAMMNFIIDCGSW